MTDYSPNGYAYETHVWSWSLARGFTRVAPKEHATQERNPLLPRDFTLPRIEDEDD